MKHGFLILCLLLTQLIIGQNCSIKNTSFQYIELIKLLKLTGVAESGGEAKKIVEEEQVQYNGKVDTRKRLKVRKGDTIHVFDHQINIT